MWTNLPVADAEMNGEVSEPVSLGRRAGVGVRRQRERWLRTDKLGSSDSTHRRRASSSDA